jgi:hypothetical protein
VDRLDFGSSSSIVETRRRQAKMHSSWKRCAQMAARQFFAFRLQGGYLELTCDFPEPARVYY